MHALVQKISVNIQTKDGILWVFKAKSDFHTEEGTFYDASFDGTITGPWHQARN